VTIHFCFNLPVLDGNNNIQVIGAYGVDDIVSVAKSRTPAAAGDSFPMAMSSIAYMKIEGERVELLFILDKA
jgi:hypothetical protein